MQNRTTIQLSESLRKELRILAGQRDVSYQELLRDMIGVFQEVDSERTLISIPTRLYARIKKQIKKTDIKTVSEYTTFLLRLLFLEDVKIASKGDEERIRKKLKKLGYL